MVMSNQIVMKKKKMQQKIFSRQRKKGVCFVRCGKLCEPLPIAMNV